MSASVELQHFVDALLRGDASVAAICSDRIFDKAPKDADFPHISMGPSDYYPDDSQCIDGRVETLQIDCWSRDQGHMAEVKTLSDAVKSALHDKTGDIGVNALVSLVVISVRNLPDPDGITAHGVVSIEAMIEEN